MKRSMLRRLALVLVFLGGSPVAGLRAQDVELLGSVYGTRPPAGYYERLRSQRDAFEFARAFRARTSEVRSALGGPLRRSEVPLGPRSGAVQGNFVFPVVLGLFADTPGQGPFTPAEVQTHFFDGPNPTGTIREFYREMSGGLVEMQGVALPWMRSQLTGAQVAGGSSGLGFQAKVGAFIAELVGILDGAGVDWGAFDNDGPDGIPNSGDDDGFVDVLTVMHPTSGAECSGNERSDQIWSHRWTLAAQGAGPFQTLTPAAGGGVIRVDDYTIQPVLSCAGTTINEIGVYAHELAHGFGLPDLYAVGTAAHAGIGQWGLMGSGSWGCPGPFNPARPCHLSAWSKLALGWLTPVDLPPGAALGVRALQPVETSRQVLRVPSGTGSGDYLLLENRQPLGFDDNMERGGLLVWAVDEAELSGRWLSNTVNSNVNRRGVRLLEADGRAQLTLPGGGRGDAGDPFPGAAAAHVLHAGSLPATRTGDGTPMGVTFLDIQEVGGTVRFALWTRYQTLTVRTAGTAGAAGLVAVDGAAPGAPQMILSSAPFQEHTFAAEPGEPLAAGVRTGFLGWDDGAPRVRTFVTGLADSTLTARYGGTEYEVAIAKSSNQSGVDPADLLISPSAADGWVAEGTEVSIEARAHTGFAFREWAGDLAGQPNPAVRRVDGPLNAEARFDVTFVATVPPAPIELTAAREVEVVMDVANANLPVRWRQTSGVLPAGLRVDPAGAIRGAALVSGTFPLTMQVEDALGLAATVPLTLQVAAPELGLDRLAGPFLLSGQEPDPVEREYLDRSGNRNGVYDLGDLRAFVVANPDLPLSSQEREVLRVLVGSTKVGPGRPR
ncbi:MAG: M6 family metalloprotease domain-containing protein [Gemmatimonadota bacterium]